MKRGDVAWEGSGVGWVLVFILFSQYNRVSGAFEEDLVMHKIWLSKLAFENLIRDAASESNLYVVIAVVESYFEFMVRVLLDKIRLTRSEQKEYWHGRAFDVLHGKRRKLLGKMMKLPAKVIDGNASNILHEVRKLRNDMLHDVLYEPDLQRLETFMGKCFETPLDPRSREQWKSSQDKLQWQFCHQVLTAYVQIVNKYGHEVDSRIAEYLKAGGE